MIVSPTKNMLERTSMTSLLFRRMQERIVSLSLRLAVILAVVAAAPSTHASSPVTNYGGHYEMVDAKAGRTFSLEIKQTDSRADVSFSAAMADGSGASPDGSGKGRVQDGILSFKFRDSFNNEGTCTLQSTSHGYQLVMTVTNVADPAPFHFYGTVLLKKISGQSP